MDSLKVGIHPLGTLAAAFREIYLTQQNATTSFLTGRLPIIAGAILIMVASSVLYTSPSRDVDRPCN